MINVLHLTLSFAHGGRRQAIAALIERLPALGVRNHLACLDTLGVPPDVAALEGPVAVIGRRSAMDARAVGRVRALARERGIDVVHAHDAASQFFAALARLGRPRPRLMMTFHRSLGFETATLRDRLRNAFAIRQTDAIVTGSRERRDHYLRENFVGPSKLVRIPFGVDLDRFRPDERDRSALRAELGVGPDEVVLGAVGHFGEVKGIDVVVRGFAALARGGVPTSVTLVVLGDGPPERREAMARLAPPPGEARVVFAGFRTDAERWFRGFDAFVHAPRQEAFGLVMLEAMASGLPVAAARVGGLTDIVRDGETGLLVPPESPEALAGAMRRLVADAALRRDLGEAARQLALAEYGADLYARRHARLYHDLIARRPPRGVDDDPGPADPESVPLASLCPH